MVAPPFPSPDPPGTRAHSAAQLAVGGRRRCLALRGPGVALEGDLEAGGCDCGEQGKRLVEGEEQRGDDAGAPDGEHRGGRAGAGGVEPLPLLAWLGVVGVTPRREPLVAWPGVCRGGADVGVGGRVAVAAAVLRGQRGGEDVADCFEHGVRWWLVEWRR